MSVKLQEIALALLAEVKKEEGLDSSIKRGLTDLLEEREAEGTDELSQKEAPTSKAEAAVLATQLNLKGQYVKRMSTLRHFGLIGEGEELVQSAVPPPSCDAVIESFSPQELQIAAQYRVPMLILVPECSLNLKVKALDSIKQKMLSHGSYINEIYTETETSDDSIKGWRAYIVEAAHELKPYEGDDPNAPFGDRVSRHKAGRRSIEKGMDRHRYCLLMMETVKRDDPIDQKLFTLLDDDPALSDQKIPAADYDPMNHWIRFNWRYPDDVNVCARFRSSVGGEQLLK